MHPAMRSLKNTALEVSVTDLGSPLERSSHRLRERQLSSRCYLVYLGSIGWKLIEAYAWVQSEDSMAFGSTCV